MSDYIDQKALEIAQRLADELGVTDPQQIARMQLAAMEGINSVLPSDEVAQNLVVPACLNLQHITGLVFSTSLPKDRWASHEDTAATALTLARQRRYIADELKVAFSSSKVRTQPLTVLPSQAVEALQSARECLLDTGTTTTSKVLDKIEDALAKTGNSPCLAS